MGIVGQTRYWQGRMAHWAHDAHVRKYRWLVRAAPGDRGDYEGKLGAHGNAEQKQGAGRAQR